MDKFKKILESNSAMSKTSEFKKTDGYKKLRDLCLKIEEGTIDCFYIYVNGFVRGIPLVETLIKYVNKDGQDHNEFYFNFLKHNDYVDSGDFNSLLKENYTNPQEILENVVYTTEDLDRLIFKFNSRIVLDKDENFFEDILLMDTNTKVDFKNVFKYIIDGSEFNDHLSNGEISKDIFEEIITRNYNKVHLIPCSRFVGAYLIRYDITKYSDISEYYVGEDILDFGYIETINNIIGQLKKRLPETKIFVNKKKEEFIDILVVYL